MSTSTVIAWFPPMPDPRAEAHPRHAASTSRTAPCVSAGGDSVAPLLLAVARGDRNAFLQLYRRTAPRLLPIALRLLRDRARAEDALQDAFLAIWCQAREFDPARGAAMSWMNAIVRNRCLDRLRVPVRELPNFHSEEHDPVEQWPDPGRGPEQWREAREDVAAVRAAIERLPGHYRQALMLAYGHGCAHAELATLLQVPVGTAKSWVRRGLAELRRNFGDAPSAAPGGTARDRDRSLIRP